LLDKYEMAPKQKDSCKPDSIEQALAPQRWDKLLGRKRPRQMSFMEEDHLKQEDQISLRDIQRDNESSFEYDFNWK